MKFVLNNQSIRQRAADAIHRAPEGMEVVIRQYRAKRSGSANSLYWVWIDRIRMHVADSTGQIYSATELHEWLKGKFLPTKTVEIGGEVQRCRLSTADLNTKQFAEYLDAVDKYCVGNLGLFLPQPGMEE